MEGPCDPAVHAVWYALDQAYNYNAQSKRLHLIAVTVTEKDKPSTPKEAYLREVAW